MSAAMFVLSFLPVSLAAAIVLASLSEPDIRALAGAAARRWGVMLVLSAAIAVLVVLSQDPWLLLGRPE